MKRVVERGVRSWSFLRRPYDHKFSFSIEEMHKDYTMFFEILFANPLGLLDGSGIMIDHDRRVTRALDLNQVRWRKPWSIHTWSNILIKLDWQESSPKNSSACDLHYYLETTNYLCSIMSVYKYTGELVTWREKVDIRKPFAQQDIFNITRIRPITDSHLSAGINRRVE
jgi:hypothetical protein